METTYTARQAAEALGVAKSSVLRAWDKLPPEMTAQGSYRGQPTKLVTRAGIQRLSMLLSVSQVNYAALDEAPRSAPSAQTSESSEAKQGEANQAELIAELRARIADKEREITRQEKELDAKQATIDTLKAALDKAQDATAREQALHAATADRLRKLEAHQEPPEPRQDEAEPERAADTTPSGESAQEAASAPTEAPAPEITGNGNQEAPPERATLAQRLRFLFRGKI